MASHHYPYATAPDIIRAHQKDAYFEGTLLDQLSDLVRQVYGSRTAHAHATETKTLAALTYLVLTTALGNRTLGEEYCDILQVEEGRRASPTVIRRAGYILASVLVPYSLQRWIPRLREMLRNDGKEGSWMQRIRAFVAKHLPSTTALSSVHIVTLTLFYFTGAYYQLSKRLLGLRYVFTKRLDPSQPRAGYEVLGVLLALQLAVQTGTRFYSILGSYNQVEVDLDAKKYTANNALLPLMEEEPSYDLNISTTMGWLHDEQQRKCILCLEAFKDPSALPCGHVYCWNCLRDWLREKAECPLCRREAMMQHVLPIRDG